MNDAYTPDINALAELPVLIGRSGRPVRLGASQFKSISW
jgi:hypothetical protein